MLEWKASGAFWAEKWLSSENHGERDVLIEELLSLPGKFFTQRRSPQEPKTPSLLPKRVSYLVRENRLGAAFRALKQGPTSILTQAQIAQLFPSRTNIVSVQGSQIFDLLVPNKVVALLKKSLRTNTAPGPSGWTHFLLQPLLSSSMFVAAFVELLQAILENNTKSQRLNSCRVIGIPKPAGGVRPIVIGEVFAKLAATLVLAIHRKRLIQLVAPFQFGFSVKGAERIIHATRNALRSGQSVITYDCINAFNSISRLIPILSPQVVKKSPFTNALS